MVFPSFEESRIDFSCFLIKYMYTSAPPRPMRLVALLFPLFPLLIHFAPPAEGLQSLHHPWPPTSSPLRGWGASGYGSGHCVIQIDDCRSSSSS